MAMDEHELYLKLDLYGKSEENVYSELEFWSDSSKMADLVLPACTTFETVRRLRLGMFALNQRAVEPVGEAKNDIEIIIELARRMIKKVAAGEGKTF